MTVNIRSVILRARSRHVQVSESGNPIVIVGCGPVGIHTAREILHHNPGQPIVLYGDEPWEPYNRVQLSALLAGELDWEALDNRLIPPPNAKVIQHHNITVTSIDPMTRTVHDAQGGVQPYSKLVLATGSHPYLPDLQGIKLDGVYSFRDKDDAMTLIKRRKMSHCTVIIGGGILGLETARAMQLGGGKVIVVDHRAHLMGQQLDTESSDILRDYITALGITTLLGDGVSRILGKKVVTGIRLQSGQEIECDTVVIAAGIRPNVELAVKAGLEIDRGIRVNNSMLTSDANIYAVGECAQHQDQIYGLAQPGMEQATVVAQNLLGKPANYRGSVVDTRLKIIGRPVMSLGKTLNDVPNKPMRTLIYERVRQGVYRKLFIRRGCLVGAIIIGNWADIDRVQEYVTKRRFLMPWQYFRFRRMGNLWSESGNLPVNEWPSTRIVCHCMGVTHGTLSQALQSGCRTAETLMERTGASSICGACRPFIDQLAQAPDIDSTAQQSRNLTAASVFAAIAVLLFLILNPVSVSDSVQSATALRALWFDGFWKQFSGYTLLTLSLVGLGFSLRKRWQFFTFATQNQWRLIHASLGTLALATLFVHTGFRLGENLNFMLMLSFLGLAIVGSVVGMLSVLVQRHSESSVQRFRSWSIQGHRILFWPLPVLLLFHIVSVYYF